MLACVYFILFSKTFNFLHKILLAKFQDNFYYLLIKLIRSESNSKLYYFHKNSQNFHNNSQCLFIEKYFLQQICKSHFLLKILTRRKFLLHIFEQLFEFVFNL